MNGVWLKTERDDYAFLRKMFRAAGEALASGCSWRLDVEGYCDSASFKHRQIINAWSAGNATTANTI